MATVAAAVAGGAASAEALPVSPVAAVAAAPTTTVSVVAPQQGNAPGSGVAPTPMQSAASLYVGDLDEGILEDQLFDLFGQIGQVTSVRVCRDAVSRRSLGYAYVNYAAPNDAATALERLNYSPINGRSMRIMWSSRDPTARKSGFGNVFIKNLDESIETKELHDTFNAFGPISSCKIALTPDGKSKGYGFVAFESEAAAHDAIKHVNGMLMKGKKVYVGLHQKKSERFQGQVAETKFTNVFIKNIDQDVSEDTLRDKFSEFGKITNLVIMKDENDKSRGFGFVNYENPDDAKAAVDAMNGTLLGTKALYVGRAQKKAEREQFLRRQFEEKRMEQIQKYQNANLYVKNLDDSMDDEGLRQEFAQYGNITSVKIMRDDKGLSRGFGFVCFSSPEEAMNASSRNGSMVRGKPIYVSMAQRKEVRHAQLQQQFAHRIPGLIPSPGAVAYPPAVYFPPGGMLPQVPQRQGMVYQPVMRPPWRAPVAPPRPTLHPIPPHYVMGPPSAQRQQRQIRNRAPVQPQPGQPLAPLPQLQIPGMQQQQQQQPRNHQARPRMKGYLSGNVRGRDGSGVGDVLSLMTVSSPQQQKQLLGERIFPLVQKHQHELAGKITGMLLEMDNTELLLLLESPDALASKVDEAMQVLQIHTKQEGDSPAAAAAGSAAPLTAEA